MKKLTAIILFIISFSLYAQKDTLIKNAAYTTLYSWELKAPIYVAYKLYHGGGDCDRSKFHFHSLGNRTATDKDYDFHYDKGHICNAEDFAYDCTLDELTFRYYNCYPQTKELNRGKWKSVETTIRAMSQKDSLLIIAGGLYSMNRIGNGVYVPDICWKVVYSLSKKSIIISKTFQNNTTPVMVDVSFDKIRQLVLDSYGVDLKELIK